MTCVIRVFDDIKRDARARHSGLVVLAPRVVAVIFCRFISTNRRGFFSDSSKCICLPHIRVIYSRFRSVVLFW